MLKQFAKRYNLVLKKGQNVHIIFTLAINYLLMWKLCLYKRLKGIKRPIVHYYALCWNEEKMLPFMFDYYDQFVDHYTIYDNFSTDNSESIIRSHSNAEIEKFSMNGEINDFIYQKIKNNCWKKSRGKADFVVVCDMDEFIYHPRIVEYLEHCLQKGVSFFRPQGYEMYSDSFPKYEDGRLLPEIVKKGVKKDAYSKSILFDPHRLVEIDYEPGAHKAHPVGIVNVNTGSVLKLLHYKQLGIDSVLDRIRLYRDRLSKDNEEAQLAGHYLLSESRIQEDFNKDLLNAIEVV